MSSIYQQIGTTYHPSDEDNKIVHKKLPVGTYAVMFNPNPMGGGFYLNKIDDMTVPEKIYGKTPTQVDRVINTYESREGNTGVLLQGEKGSGKTLFAKVLSADLRAKDVPTIVVNAPYHGEDFNAFINSIDQDCLIFFDEFEKVYHEHTKQQALLTLFDGIYKSKKMFVVALNEIRYISTYFQNRPGRFFYSFTYRTLDKEFIDEYIDDVLTNVGRKEELKVYLNLFSELSFDILKACVEEINRYDEPVGELLRILNASPLELNTRFKVESVVTKKEGLKIEDWDKDVNNGNSYNPFTSKTWISLYTKKKTANVGFLSDDDEKDGDLEICFTPKDIIKIEKNKYTLDNDKATVVIIREDPPKQNMHMELLRFAL